MQWSIATRGADWPQLSIVIEQCAGSLPGQTFFFIPRSLYGASHMRPRRVVLLSDGTGNSTAQVWRTNVWRMFSALDLANDEQVAFAILVQFRKEEGRRNNLQRKLPEF